MSLEKTLIRSGLLSIVDGTYTYARVRFGFWLQDVLALLSRLQDRQMRLLTSGH